MKTRRVWLPVSTLRAPASFMRKDGAALPLWRPPSESEVHQNKKHLLFMDAERLSCSWTKNMKSNGRMWQIYVVLRRVAVDSHPSLEGRRRRGMDVVVMAISADWAPVWMFNVVSVIRWGNWEPTLNYKRQKKKTPESDGTSSHMKRIHS